MSQAINIPVEELEQLEAEASFSETETVTTEEVDGSNHLLMKVTIFVGVLSVVTYIGSWMYETYFQVPWYQFW